VTEGSPIIQRSYELIYQLEKKITVGNLGNLNANTGQEDRYFSKLLEDGVHISYPTTVD
jgi:hypothetical protein